MCSDISSEYRKHLRRLFTITNKPKNRSTEEHSTAFDGLRFTFASAPQEMRKVSLPGNKHAIVVIRRARVVAKRLENKVKTGHRGLIGLQDTKYCRTTPGRPKREKRQRRGD